MNAIKVIAFALIVAGVLGAFCIFAFSLVGVHARLDALIAGMKDADYQRTFMHPENGMTPLATWVQLYGWHSRHHVAHITALRNAKGWST